MARINSALLQRLQDKLGVGEKRVYARIKAIANARLLPNELAALVLAADSGIGINRYASPDQLSRIRSGRHSEPQEQLESVQSLVRANTVVRSSQVSRAKA